MSNNIILKKSSVGDKVPLASDLEHGELALNFTDGNLFYKNNSNVVTTIASNKFVSVTGNVTGGNINTAGDVRATAGVYGLELYSTQSSGDEGGQVNLGIPATNTSLTGQVTIDIFQNKLRFFQGNNAKGAYIDLTAAADGVGTNLLAGGGGTPGGANTYVQFNDGGAFGGNASFTYDKVLNTVTAGTFAGTLNGLGQNFKVGDDAWIGDINAENTIGIKGQQDAANAYIVFGNSDATGKLGRDGTGPLTYSGAFSATGNITGDYFIGNGSQLTGIASGGITWTTQANATPSSPAPGDFWFDSYTGVKYQYVNDGTSNVWIDQSFPTSFSTLAVSGNATIGGNISANYFVGNGSQLTGLPAGYANADVAAYLPTYTGNLVSLTGAVTTTANITGGNVLTGGLITATGNITGGNVLTGGLITATANITGGNVLTGGLITATGNITGGNILTAGLVSLSSIVKTGTDGVGNIGASGSTFNTVFAKATSAQYADLAEIYRSDQAYEPGTVLVFGGLQEVTTSDVSHDIRIAGVVSTAPAYLMNNQTPGVAVALTGRVPCRVRGPVAKGDQLVNITTGIAGAIDFAQYRPGCVIGKSLESIADSSVQVIEIAVGRY
jgi:hypothetical protein